MRANGIVYHREGINGDYDDFDDVGSIDRIYKNRKQINGNRFLLKQEKINYFG